MGLRRPALALLCILALGCTSAQDAAAGASWTRVQEASGPERIEAAHALALTLTPAVAQQVLDARGAFAGDEAQAWLLGGAARLRDDGVAWLARQVYGDSLESAFADSLAGIDSGSEAHEGWTALPDVLLELFDGDAQADRWLALLASYESDLTAPLLERLRSDAPARTRLRAALDRLDRENALPTGVLAALGRASNPDEAAWLQRRYGQLFAQALDGMDIDDQGAFDEASELFRAAFDDAPRPLAEEDRAVAERLPDVFSGSDEAPEDLPSFDDVARFMTRHRRTNWKVLLEAYAGWGQLPTNALAYVCRASADECADLLSEPEVKEIAAAADVAPALDLEGGDVTMSCACDQLPPDQARQLAARAIGAGMPLAVRESGVACLAILGDDVTQHWRTLLHEAVATGDWRMAEHLASLEPELVDESMQQAAIAAVRSGRAPAFDLPQILALSDDGRRALSEAILAADPHALDANEAGQVPSLLSAAIRSRRGSGRTSLVPSEPIILD